MKVICKAKNISSFNAITRTVVTKNVTSFTVTLIVIPMNSGMIINRLLALWQIECMICVV